MPQACTLKPDCPRWGPRSAAELIARYDGRVPRYTSYPTAPHFHEGVGEAQYRGWLRRLDPADAVSLYLHVPFCEQLCWYCGCHTAASPRAEPVADYAARLLDEIALVTEAVGRRLNVGAIHFGGGTPNILSGADFGSILDRLRTGFRLGPDTELAVECDPRTLTRDWIEAAVSAGVNRISLGVQDVDPKVQRAVHRWQPFSRTRWAVETLREAGIAAINLDLMYGLPHQTTMGLRATVEQVLTLAPDRIALFGYAHVPWMKPAQRLIPEEALPGPLERFRQQEVAADDLEERGYVRVGLDHFARPGDRLARALARGTVRRNFQGYTTDQAETLIGLGASSIGHLPAGYVQNVVKVPLWRTAVGRGHLPVARGLVLSTEDRFRGEIIARLMCDLAVDLLDVAGRHDVSPDGLLPDLVRLCRFEQDGLIRRRDRYLTVTERGRPFVRAICAVFDRYLDPCSIRHAPSI
ncbi:oxygen-independent coproporphyrinogen III oxidase [Labrys wisconsinensis]|uniref:Coproporphyrinogen-III oxidase n=1 Tax=Labrys wisconsinensis TaxID=425677 RepID=A0ABU0J8S1_9HYPH|nr:oxygen-independent coproporphyrinogen III oxidase [Labrys wisconsinensis]MDQ0469828.1 oxygen-independent coproporphyrinogen-3 oxidase [Labrys wisconsinensis]